MPDNFGRMTSDEAPQSLKDFCFPKQEQKEESIHKHTPIAEIRRLRAHRKCPCGGLGGIKKMRGKYWAECNNCECSTDTFDTTEKAWAAWDGVE